MSQAKRRPLRVMHYEPPAGYSLDVELYRGPELRRRARHVDVQNERVDFHVLLCLTRSGYRHMVDCDWLDCGAGSLVTVRPGQVHRFGDLKRFAGWLLLFRSELIPPAFGRGRATEFDLARQLAGLPSHLSVPRFARRPVTESLERMADDAKLPATPALNMLLNSQLHAILARLSLVGTSTAAEDRVELTVLERFQRYRSAVEREHRRWHTVERYAKHLGCSTKSLNRAAREVADISAKALLTERIVLEAKRLLAHTVTPVAVIGDELGFDEATNFGKFFRRETGTTPGAFRRQHRNQ